MGTAMAVFTVQLQGLAQLHHLVLNGGVALVASHVVLGNMNRMHQRRVPELLDPFKEVMAGPTAILFGSPISDGNVRVALGA